MLGLIRELILSIAVMIKTANVKSDKRGSVIIYANNR